MKWHLPATDDELMMIISNDTQNIPIHPSSSIVIDTAACSQASQSLHGCEITAWLYYLQEIVAISSLLGCSVRAAIIELPIVSSVNVSSVQLKARMHHDL